MTISSSSRRAGPYTSTGTGPFSFSFKVFEEADIRVVQADSDSEADLVLTTDYTVSLNADQNANPGGTITLVVAQVSGQSTTIIGGMESTQETDIQNAGGFYPEVIENAIDKATILIQQLEEESDRSLLLPVSVSGVSSTLPVPEASKLLGWNVGATAIVNTDTSGVGAGGIGTTELADGSVTTAKIADLAVTTAKLNTASVSAAKLTTSIISDLTTVTIASGDYLFVGDVSDSTKPKKALVSDVVSLSAMDIDGLTEDTTPDLNADFVPTYDTSATANKKVKLKNIGKIIQVVNSTTSAVATGTTTTPKDDTIPQNTEGDQYLSLAITPTNASNKLLIEVQAVVANTAGGGSFIMALHQDSTANALAAVIQGYDSSNKCETIPLSWYMTAGTTSATTFKVRVGSDQAASTTTLNGASGSRLMGGVMSSWITITEIAV